MCRIDGDAPDVYRTANYVARIQHRCSECSRVIYPGERYSSAFMIYEGTPETFRTCTHCQVGQAWLAENCNMIAHGMLMDEMTEHAGYAPENAFGFLRIKAGMRRQWKRFDGAGLMRHPPLPVAVGEYA